MLTRFELFVILRNQVSDRTVVRRSEAVEVTMEALARLAGADPTTWGLAGLGADIDAELCLANPGRRGAVAAELLATEGAPPEVCAAVASRRDDQIDAMPLLAAALVAAERIVDAIAEDAESAAHRLRRAAERRGEPAALRALDALARLGVPLDAAVAAARVEIAKI